MLKKKQSQYFTYVDHIQLDDPLYTNDYWSACFKW